MPLTDATECGGYTSAGRLSTIVDNAAYAKVETAKQATSHGSDVSTTAGISSVIPKAQITMTNLRAAPTDQPRAIKRLDRPPPKKLPRSAARNGTQNASRLLSSLNPLATRKIANQSVMKNHTGSVSVLPMMMPHVCGSDSSVR